MLYIYHRNKDKFSLLNLGEVIVNKSIYDICLKTAYNEIENRREKVTIEENGRREIDDYVGSWIGLMESYTFVRNYRITGYYILHYTSNDKTNIHQVVE